MTQKFTRKEREYLRQLIVECDIQRFNSEESLNFIASKLKRSISYDYFTHMKRKIRREVSSRLNDLRQSKDAYMQQFFERIDECKKYQQELWRLFHRCNDRPEIQRACLTELREVTLVLTQLYDVLPFIPAFGFSQQIELDQDKEKEGEEENENESISAITRENTSSDQEAKF
jgi:hypothetical protein